MPESASNGRERVIMPRSRFCPGVLIVLLASACCSAHTIAADWPAYRADAARSAVTAEKLPFPLAKIWTYEPPQAPRPAWPEPGKELHRMDFDYALQPVVAGGLVYFGSSADDTVRALDAATGHLRWRFTTGGPVRFAPAIADGRCYVASDDGWLYCLDAATGKELWRFHAAPADDQLIGNGRMISRWPLRSGVLVEDGIAYVTAGMWPAEGIYVYALDAATGRQIWRNDSSGEMYLDLPHPGASAFTGVAPQGYLLASDDVLLVPTGRSVPAAFDRRTGRLLYYRPASTQFNGGTWVAVAGDLFFNQQHARAPHTGARTGECEPEPGDGMAAYSLRGGQLVAQLPNKHRVLIAQDMLYATGGGQVDAIDRKAWLQKGDFQKSVKWTAPHGRAYCLALAGEALLVGGRGSVTAFNTATGEEIWKAQTEGQVRGLAVADGRLLVATNKGTIVCFAARTEGIPAQTVREEATPNAAIPDKHKKLAAEIVRRTAISEGYALIAGEPDSNLAVALASQTDLHVITLTGGADLAAEERKRLLTTKLYGSRVAVQALEDATCLPYASYFANLVVVSGVPAGLSAKELYRVLRPCGGVMYFCGSAGDSAPALIREAGIGDAEVRRFGSSLMVVRGKLPGAGEWRHQWADGGRTGIGNENRLRLPLDVLWFGGPGPDRMMDRHTATSAPLSVNGRVFMTGEHHVIAFDAYNGRELWCREMRGAGRAAVRSASANFVADDHTVYVAIGPSCYRLDQATGQTVAAYNVPEALSGGADAASDTQVVDVRWPQQWVVFGPFPKHSPPAPAAMLSTIPQQMLWGGKRFLPATLDSVRGVLDFTYLYGGYGFEPLAPGQKPEPYPRGDYALDPDAEGRIAYAYATITCPTAGKLKIGAGAEWWMQWYLDGKPIYDTLKTGNLGRPATYTDHVFTADVSAGEHVLAVMVVAGRRGWTLASAAGARYEDDLEFVPHDARAAAWGYLSVTDDLILGTYRGRALFALNKSDGGARWIYRPRRMLDNVGIAHGDGRLFATDAMPRDWIDRARRRGERIKAPRTLVALDLATGRELWRRPDLPQTPYYVQYARGVVTVNGNAAYDARTGRKLWQRRFEPARLPVIYDNWIIAQPRGFDLRTGAPRMTSDALTDEQRPWMFARAYGCGPVTGCKDLLFFRSGMAGFYDFTNDGTTTFGGMRPGCGITMIPANGLLILPQGDSGCSCGYNFQTSLALLPSDKRRDSWYVFAGEKPTEPIRRCNLNFGAPGDRNDRAGDRWLGFPRPVYIEGACPAPVKLAMSELTWYFNPSEASRIKGTDRPWIYTSGLKGRGRITIELSLDPRIEVLSCGEPPSLDGVLDDACWAGARPVRFKDDAHLMNPKATLFVRRDAETLFFGFRREAVIRDGRPVPFVATQSGDDARCWLDDSLEIFVSDGKLRRCIQLGISCSGGTFQRLYTVGRGRWIDPPKWRAESWADPQWSGPWKHAVSKETHYWSAEVAIPLKTIREAGIDLSDLRLNARAYNQSGYGRSLIHIVPISAWKDYVYRIADMPSVVGERREVPKRRFTVRLHFAEPQEVAAGERLFDVSIQGQTVLEDFDIVRETGGRLKAVVKEFKGIEAGEALRIELVPTVSDPTPEQLPLLNAIELFQMRP